MNRSVLNVLLILANATVLSLFAWPGKDPLRPYVEFWPEAQMSRTAAYKSFTPNPNFTDGMTLRAPPPNTLARGQLALHYESTPADAVRAGLELHNPFSADDSARLQRGATIFASYCQVCHGPTGLGNGPVTQHGFPAPPSLSADRARQMQDGQIFHVLTYGQGNMSSYAGQLSPHDRWCAVLHVRKLQGGKASDVKPILPSPGLTKAAGLFQENCSACHGLDGTGNMVRKALPLIPDFTNLAWQMAQTDIAIVNQIDYGSLPLMPSFRYKLTRDEILELAVFVRSFALGKAAGAAPAAPVTARLTAVNLFQTFCFTCHDNSGRGIVYLRKTMPELPDFTSEKWQKSRTDADLSHSILEGKGKFMLSMKDKLGPVNVHEMVALIRKFEGGKQVIPIAAPKYYGPPAPEKIEAPVVGLPTPPPNASASELPLVGVPGDTAARIRVGSSIFRQFCIVCHGPDGTGNQMRASLPLIPNFTAADFHRTHTDAQLQASILDGKGALMPANRGRVTEGQARDLVAYVRSFGPPGSQGIQLGTGDFEKRFNALQAQWDALNKELQTASPPPKKP